MYLLQELYQSRFDLAMWSKKYSETKWSTIQKNLWKLHMPYPLHPEDTLPCSYTNIFGPNSESGLMYHQIWRKVLLEDILLSLDEAASLWIGLDWCMLCCIGESCFSLCVSEVFKRFRDTYLTYGSAIPPAELFRRFRGRDLNPQLFLKKIETSIESPEMPIISEDIAPVLAR
ncbi:unnamed protein product [Schistosoma mattheei]|uniref:Uncharacterized protein n=1 Tax=Schistosoma mattheei TaxID=31246 RepID=A0A3P8G4V0_9TREM|nr:unnamed protein product [Schistosoma mattheei]